MFSTKEVEASYGDHQVEIRAIEAATGHSSQPEQEAEAEEGVEAGGQGTAAGPLGEQFDHDDDNALSHVSVTIPSALCSEALLTWVSCDWLLRCCAGPGARQLYRCTGAWVGARLAQWLT